MQHKKVGSAPHHPATISDTDADTDTDTDTDADADADTDADLEMRYVQEDEMQKSLLLFLSFVAFEYFVDTINLHQNAVNATSGFGSTVQMV